MAKLFFVVLCLLGIAFLFLCVNIILHKNGTFHSEDVGANEAMRSRGIHCYRTQDRLAQADKSKITDMMK